MNKPQTKLYELLVEFDRICKKNKINYFLDGGTFLGAVRHKGFIPWDDDLDVSMLRKDYDKFVKVINKDLKSSYFFQDMDTDPNYGCIFGKLRIKNTKYTERISINTKAKDGIFIDIFPFDNISDNPKKAKIQFLKILIYRLMLLNKNKYIIEANTCIKKMELFIIKILSIFNTKKHIKKRINNLLIKYNNRQTNYLCNYSTPYFNKIMFDKKWFRSYDKYEFENNKFSSLKDYDLYLKYLYNDYMKLPPVEKRVSHGIVLIEYEDGKIE